MKTKNTVFYSILLIMSSLFIFSSCVDTIIGSGRVVQETRDVKSFTAIDISGAFKVYLTQGDEESLMLEADDNLLQYVETYVSGGTLYIDTEGFGFRSSSIKVFITVVNLSDVEASGAVSITGETPLEFSRLAVGVSGAAEIDLELYGERMELGVSGAGKSYLTGEVDKIHVNLSGASKMNAETLNCRFMEIEISGAGSANVNVEEKLMADISGAGVVRYIGNPEVRSNVSGAGKVSRMK